MAVPVRHPGHDRFFFLRHDLVHVPMLSTDARSRPATKQSLIALVQHAVQHVVQQIRAA